MLRSRALTLLSLILLLWTLLCGLAGSVFPGGWGTSWSVGGRHYWVDTNNRFLSITTGSEFAAGKKFSYPTPYGRVVKWTERPVGGGVYVGRSHRDLDVKVGSDRNMEYRWLRIPLGYVIVATGLLPLVWLSRRVARWLHGRRIRAAGLCRGCGYDVRATPDRCPECGLHIDKLPVSPQATH